MRRTQCADHISTYNYIGYYVEWKASALIFYLVIEKYGTSGHTSISDVTAGAIIDKTPAAGVASYLKVSIYKEQ